MVLVGHSMTFITVCIIKNPVVSNKHEKSGKPQNYCSHKLKLSNQYTKKVIPLLAPWCYNRKINCPVVMTRGVTMSAEGGRVGTQM